MNVDELFRELKDGADVLAKYGFNRGAAICREAADAIMMQFATINGLRQIHADAVCRLCGMDFILPPAPTVCYGCQQRLEENTLLPLPLDTTPPTG